MKECVKESWEKVSRSRGLISCATDRNISPQTTSCFPYRHEIERRLSLTFFLFALLISCFPIVLSKGTTFSCTKYITLAQHFFFALLRDLRVSLEFLSSCDKIKLECLFFCGTPDMITHWVEVLFCELHIHTLNAFYTVGGTTNSDKMSFLRTYTTVTSWGLWKQESIEGDLYGEWGQLLEHNSLVTNHLSLASDNLIWLALNEDQTTRTIRGEVPQKDPREAFLEV